MALKTLVKVGSITNLSDARYCAGMGVDFLGFRVVEGQPDAISVKTYQEIRGWITGPQIVAEVYGIRNAEELGEIMEGFRPDYLELSVKEWEAVGGGITVPFILSVGPDDEVPEMATPPAYILTNTAEGSVTRLIPEFEILASVSDPGELDATLSLTGVSGINLTGGKEIRPGLKQYDHLADILEALESD